MAFEMVAFDFPVAFAAHPRVYAMGYPIVHFSLMVNFLPVRAYLSYAQICGLRMPGHRRDVDELPAFLGHEMLQRRVDAPEHALDIDIDGLIPFVDAPHGQRRQRHGAGIVDQDIELAKCLDRKVDERRHVIPVGDIQPADGHMIATQPISQRLKAVQSAGTQHDFRARLDKVTGRFGTKAGTAAGDGNDLAADIFHFHSFQIGCRGRLRPGGRVDGRAQASGIGMP